MNCTVSRTGLMTGVCRTIMTSLALAQKSVIFNPMVQLEKYEQVCMGSYSEFYDFPVFE